MGRNGTTKGTKNTKEDGWKSLTSFVSLVPFVVNTPRFFSGRPRWSEQVSRSQTGVGVKSDRLDRLAHLANFPRPVPRHPEWAGKRIALTSTRGYLHCLCLNENGDAGTHPDHRAHGRAV